MKRNLKTLGLALIAVLAMSAMVASAAGAATFTATEGAKITATDSGSVKFTVTGTEVTCGNAVYTGTAPAASFASITVNATFSECKTAISSATILGFGAGECDFVLYAGGTADLVCAAGKDVTISAGPCVVHIPGQIGLDTLGYSNNGSHVDINLGVTQINGNHTDGFLCPFGSSGNSSEGWLETLSGSPLTAISNAGAIAWDK